MLEYVTTIWLQKQLSGLLTMKQWHKYDIETSTPIII
jgi:hypothetical protein